MHKPVGSLRTHVVNAPVPDDVRAALAHVGWCAASAQPINTLPAARRAVYRVELVTQRIIKARRLDDEPTAHQLCTLRAALPAAFAPVLARHGRVLLEAWIDGDDVRERPLDDPLVRRAGGLMAELHAITPALPRAVYPLESIVHWWTDAARVLEALHAAGLLETRVWRALGAALQRLVPSVRRVGLMHTDFCGDNMVVDAQGGLHVIDTERLTIGEQGFDLARTWYRWPMPAAYWQQFLAAYAARGGTIDCAPAQVYWRLLALASAVLIRLRQGGDAHAPLDRLRALVAEVG